VVMTVLRGQTIFNSGDFVLDKPHGVLLADSLE
jgi:hypothetical protein